MIDWIGLGVTIVGAAIGAALPLTAFAFWLGGLQEKLLAVIERCKKREADHCHHYQKLNEHSVAIGKIDTRITSLEQWRTELE